MRSFLPGRLYSNSILFAGCFLILSLSYSYAQVADYSKSYINITKGINGGTIETGDIVEIRSTFVVRSGTFDSCAYYDMVPSGTTYISNTIRILTNEGKVYKQFTDAISDDAGWINGTAIRINFGNNPLTTPGTAYRRGTVAYSDKPAYYTSACIMVASFRVTVTATAGTNISIGGGNITLKNGINPIQTYTYQPKTLKVYSNYGLGTGLLSSNVFSDETKGTFGNGKPRNRTASSNVPTSYNYQPLNIGTPNDNCYGISNNTSTRLNYTTLNTWPNPDTNSPSHRVFGLWDIIGDHTGAVSAPLGNPAADTVTNSNAGYMLVVNSAYKTDSAFQATVSGLCPNTLYEITGWFRNMCRKCGCDSNGKAATDLTGFPFYIPTGTGDSSGVAPNLIFEINGIDYYTTGNMTYTGQWIKKGFSFLTGTSQTSFILRIFNNAPAGSGNDWTLDDINVASVSPIMNYAPGIASIVCENNAITIYDTIRSAAGNYSYYKWQRSTNGGASWTDITSALGPVTPTLNGNLWQYVASYTILATSTTQSDSGNLYRAIVSGMPTSLSNATCSFTGLNQFTLRVINCGVPLDISLLFFSGTVKSNAVFLNWSTTGENEPLKFDIEKSINNSGFKVIHSIDGLNISPDVINNYSWADPDLLKEKVYYRLKIYNSVGKIKYSSIIVFNSANDSFDLITINNPFGSLLQFDIYSGKNRTVQATLIDAAGNPVRNIAFSLFKGVNSLNMNSAVLSRGVYIFRLYSNGEVINRKLIKQ